MWKRNKNNKNFKRQHDEAKIEVLEVKTPKTKAKKNKQTLFTLTPHGYAGEFRIHREEYPKQYALIERINKQRFVGNCRIRKDYIMFEVKSLTFNALTSSETQFTMKCGFVACGPRCLRISCVSQSEGVDYTDFIAERIRIAKAKEDAEAKIIADNIAAAEKLKADRAAAADALLFDDKGFFMF